MSPLEHEKILVITPYEAPTLADADAADANTTWCTFDEKDEEKKDYDYLVLHRTLDAYKIGRYINLEEGKIFFEGVYMWFDENGMYRGSTNSVRGQCATLPYDKDTILEQARDACVKVSAQYASFVCAIVDSLHDRDALTPKRVQKLKIIILRLGEPVQTIGSARVLVFTQQCEEEEEFMHDEKKITRTFCRESLWEEQVMCDTPLAMSHKVLSCANYVVVDTHHENGYI